MAQLQATGVTGSLVTTGNIGIGTITPTARLHIGNNTSTYGPTIFLDGTFESSASVGHSRIYFNDNNFGIGAGKWGPGADDDLYIWAYNGGGRDIRFAFTTDGSQPVTSSDWTTRMILKSEGSLGIGTITPTADLHVYEDLDVWHARFGTANGELRIGGCTGNGAVIQAYTPAGVTRQLYIQRDGGNVGIATTAPAGLLHLNGAGGNGIPSFRITSTASDIFNWASSTEYPNLATGETVIHLFGKANSVNNQAYVGYRHVSDGSTGNMLSMGLYGQDYLVNITAAGNMGIGITTPTAPLHIVKDLGTGVSAVARLRGTNSTARTTRLQFEDYNGTIADGLIDFIIPTAGSSTGARLDIGVDSAIMSLVKGGNVGIGTTTPSDKLHIWGSGNTAAFITGQGCTTYIQSVTTETRIGNLSSGGGAIVFQPADTEKVRITSDGNVGIGITNPGHTLDVNGVIQSKGYIASGNYDGPASVPNTGIFSTNINFSDGFGSLIVAARPDAARPIVFATYNGSSMGERMRINSSGNVGIGTTTPGRTLHVSSTIAEVMRLQGTSGGLSNNTQLRFYGSHAGAELWAIGTEVATGTTGRAFDFYDLIADANRLRITAGGTLLVSGSVTPYEPAWKGTAVLGPDGQDKVIIGFLTSSYTGATIGGHNSALSSWADLNLVGGNLIFRYQEVEYMRMNTSGNFGVGTSSPTNKLHIRGGAADDVIARFETTGTGTSDYAEIHIANNNNDRLIFGSIGSNYTNTDWAGARYVYNTSGKLYLKSVDELQLFSGGTSLSNITMTLTKGGNVGIGTTSPSIYSLLHVNTKKILITSTSNNWGQLQVANPSDGESTIAVAAGGSGAVGNDSTYTRQWVHGINPYGTGTSRYTFTTKYRQSTTPALMMEEEAGGNIGINPSGGNVGINTISAAANLHVDSGTTGATAYPFRVDASSLDYALYVSASGNVAVGGLVPANALNHRFVVWSGSVSLRGPNEAAYSYRLNDTGGTNRNALYVSSSNYLNVGNANFAGIELFHTAGSPTSTVGGPPEEYYGTDGAVYLAKPDEWLAVRVAGTVYAIPMYIAP